MSTSFSKADLRKVQREIAELKFKIDTILNELVEKDAPTKYIVKLDNIIFKLEAWQNMP